MDIRDIFIIMPFTEQRLHTPMGERIYTTAHLDDIYTILQQAVAEHDDGLAVTRMEQPYGNLVSAIIRRLARSDVVIAVLSGRNPNVFYELGIRHALRQNTIMLVEHRDEYPFDLTAYFSHQFSIEHETGRSALKAFIRARLKEISERTLPDSPVIDVLKTNEFEQFRTINMWETRRAAMVLDGVVREVRGVMKMLVDAANHAYSVTTNEPATNERLRPMQLIWTSMDGLTKQRPLPGLPAAAYIDAHMYSQRGSC